MYIKSISLHLILSLICLTHLQAESMPAILLPSTESDPDAFIDHSTNVINGDYCESVTDLAISGPDALILQRYYNTKNYITGNGYGGWRIFPQTLLVVGRDRQAKECKIEQDRFEWAYAFTGERSGGILSYSGWKKIDGDTKDPLKIDHKDTIGMVNSYAGEMNGQTNHLNNQMHFKQDICTIILGDGTKRIYQKVKTIPTEIFGEEITLTLGSKVNQPQYYHLVSETLPSKNVVLFSYDAKGHLSEIEMKNASQQNVHSWLHFDYDFNNKGCVIKVSASDEKTLTYSFESIQLEDHSHFILKAVKGSHGIPTTYDYEIRRNTCYLTRKCLPEGRFLEINYDEQGRVKSLKGPSGTSGKPEVIRSFAYGDKFTDMFNADHIKTRYHYDSRLQLVVIDRYDQAGKIYRSDRKHYGKSNQDQTFLLARTITDGEGRTHSYRCFKYDCYGNVLEERLYGNLTGKKEVSLKIDANGQLLNSDQEECHLKTYSYSDDGFNLVTRMGDCKGNKTTYSYEKGSNRLNKKLICEKNDIQKREFRFYNDDGACIKIVEDDGEDEDYEDSDSITEKHITKLTLRKTLPGVGLTEILAEKAFDRNSKKEILVKKLVYTYSPQGQILTCATHDANDVYVHTVAKTYDHLGQILTDTDPSGKTTSYSYDSLGNQTLISIPHQNKIIEKKYDFKNNLIQTIETAGNLQSVERKEYDILNRQVASTDRFGQTTYFEYDAFDRLTKVIHPSVLDEHEKFIQPTFLYTYDIFGNVLTVTDPKGYTTRKDYNLRGSPTKIYYPDGTQEMFKYDPEGTLHRSMTRDQIITVYEYDYLGRISYEEDSSVSKSDVPFITGRKYEYNGFRCKKLINRYLSNDDCTVFNLDAAGRIISIVKFPDGYGDNHPQSRKTDIVYDSQSRESKRKVWFDFGPSDYSVECFEYDALGNIARKELKMLRVMYFFEKALFMMILDDASKSSFTIIVEKKRVLKLHMTHLETPFLVLMP